MQFQRVAGWAGLGFATSVIIANLVTAVTGQPPGVGAGPDEVTAFFAEHGDAARVSSGIAPIAWMFLSVFAAGMFARLWKLEQPRGEAWSLVGLVGAGLLIAFFGTVISSQIALVDGAGADLWSLHNATFGVNAVGISIAVTGFSMAGLRTGVLRPWHAYVGLASGLLSLAGAATAPWSATDAATALSGLGFAGFGLWILWVVTSALRLLRTRAGLHQGEVVSNTPRGAFNVE